MNISEESAILAIQTECFTDDEEIDHKRADAILCEFLRSLGYNDLVDEFDRVHKWYA